MRVPYIIRASFLAVTMVLAGCGNGVDPREADFQNLLYQNGNFDFKRYDALFETRCSDEFLLTMEDLTDIQARSTEISFPYTIAIRDDHARDVAHCLDMIDHMLEATRITYDGLSPETVCMTTLTDHQEIVGRTRVQLESFAVNPLSSPGLKTKAFTETGGFNFGVIGLSGMAKINYTTSCALAR